jgi:hypothetical protein
LAMAICILLAGRSLTGRKRSWFAFVVSCTECLFFSFRNDSRPVYECRALARFGESVVFSGNCASARLT